jgi:hypothetical protein
VDYGNNDIDNDSYFRYERGCWREVRPDAMVSRRFGSIYDVQLFEGLGL